MQYSYDDRSIVVVNDRFDEVKNVRVSRQVFDFHLVPKFSRDAAIDVPPDGVVRALTIPVTPDLTKTYFLRLRLTDAAGRELSRNFYWLSAKGDVTWPSREARPMVTAGRPRPRP